MSYYFDSPFHAVVHSPEDAPFVLSAVAHLLRTGRDRLAVERALKHVFLSVDAPVGNFTHVTAGDETFRDFVFGLDAWDGRLSPHVASLTCDTAHAFDFEPQEFYRRVVQVYDVDYSNFMPYAPSVKRTFLTDDPVQRKNFGHLFLAWYDRDWYREKTPGAREAVEWLKGLRRYLAQHVVVPRRPPAQAPDAGALEGELIEALAAALDAVSTRVGDAPHVPYLSEAKRQLEHALRLAPRPGDHGSDTFEKVLGVLQLPAPRALLFRRVAAAREALRYRDSWQLPADDAAAVTPAVARLATATDACLRWAW